MKKKYCEECMVEHEFERVTLIEEVSIRGRSFMVEHEYDKCKNCEVLFEPHEDVDKNLKKEYSMFRSKAGYLQPEEIAEIRNKYKMTLRQFASVLGIGYSTLSNIENGSLQNDYQDSLFRLASSPAAFYELVKLKKDFIKENVDEAIERVEIVCLKEEPALQELNVKFDKVMTNLSEQVNYSIRDLNALKYDVKQINKESAFEEPKEEKDSLWTKKISNILQPS